MNTTRKKPVSKKVKVKAKTEIAELTQAIKDLKAELERTRLVNLPVNYWYPYGYYPYYPQPYCPSPYFYGSQPLSQVYTYGNGITAELTTTPQPESTTYCYTYKR